MYGKVESSGAIKMEWKLLWKYTKVRKCMFCYGAWKVEKLTASIFVCPKLSTSESFIHPLDDTQYPLKPTVQLNILSLSEITEAITAGKPCVVGKSGPPMDLEKLLYYEPYANLAEAILQDIFNEDIPNWRLQTDFSTIWLTVSRLFYQDAQTSSWHAAEDNRPGPSQLHPCHCSTVSAVASSKQQGQLPMSTQRTGPIQCLCWEKPTGELTL